MNKITLQQKALEARQFLKKMLEQALFDEVQEGSLTAEEAEYIYCIAMNEQTRDIRNFNSNHKETVLERMRRILQR